jgi:small nuclear ribonucleoprotein (snRNP)-like protein
LNNIIVANIICEHDLKHKFIGYLVPQQAMKVSVRNRNSNELMSPSNTENFATYKIKLAYGGAQMDAEHEVEGGDVAEMMQTIAALVQNGYMMEEAFDIYDLIGQTIRESIPEFRKAIDKQDDNKVDFLLGKALIDSLSKETSGDKLGLAGAFIRRAEHLIKTHASKDIDIPFSANSIKGKFISEVASKVNKAIKRRCPGLGTVQAPSYRIMSHFIHNGQVVSYRRLIELLQDETVNINGIDIPVIDYVSGLYSEGQLSEESASKFNYRDPARNLFDNQMIGLDGTILNPFIKRLSDSSRKTLKIEDTVVVRRIGSSEEGQVIALKDLRELDFFQNVIDTSQFEIYVWENQSRELRSSVTEITLDSAGINGLAKSTISTNELDVNRALFYIYEYFDDQNLILGKEAHAKTFDYYRHSVDPEEIAAMQIAEDQRKMEVIRRVVNSHIELAEYRNLSDVELKANFKKIVGILKQISQQINTQLSDAKRKKKEVFLPVQLSMISSETSPEDVAVLMSNPIRIKKVDTKLPQIIAGRAYLSLLGIGPSDNVWDITGPEYFEARIREADRLPSVKEVPTYAYDCECTLEDGRKVLVKLKNDEAEDFINQDNVKVGNKHFSNHIGSLLYGNKEVCDSDGINAYTYYSENGNDYNVLVVNTIEDFKRLVESGSFNYVQYNYTTSNYEQLLEIQEIDSDSTLQRYSGIKYGQANTEEVPLSEVLKSDSPEFIVDALREDNDIRIKRRRVELANER